MKTIVRIADIMAYLNHDLDDAIRSNVVSAKQIPKSCVSILGENHLRTLYLLNEGR